MSWEAIALIFATLYIGGITLQVSSEPAITKLRTCALAAHVQKDHYSDEKWDFLICQQGVRGVRPKSWRCTRNYHTEHRILYNSTLQSLHVWILGRRSDSSLLYWANKKAEKNFQRNEHELHNTFIISTMRWSIASDVFFPIQTFAVSHSACSCTSLVLWLSLHGKSHQRQESSGTHYGMR